VFCTEISQLKHQEVSLRDSNLLLDAALENMSQGLCLYDEQNRLQVANRRFYEIFKLSRDRIRPGTHYRDVLNLSVSLNNHVGKSAEQLLQEQREYLHRGIKGAHFIEFGDGRVVS
jgi:PAS domain-containing protein